MTNRVTELRVESAGDAATVTSLNQGISVGVLGRSNGWMRVRTPDGQVGWLRAFHVRIMGGVELSGVKPLRFNSDAKDNQPKRATASMGLRGISTAQLRTSNPNPVAWRKLQMFKANVDVAQRAAHEAGLMGLGRDNTVVPPAAAAAKGKSLDDLVQ